MMTRGLFNLTDKTVFIYFKKENKLQNYKFKLFLLNAINSFEDFGKSEDDWIGHERRKELMEVDDDLIG